MERDKPLRKLVAILYADVAEYSRLTGLDEEGTHTRLRARLDVIGSCISEHDGRVVNYAGDAVLAEFGTVTEALKCATRMQEAIAKSNGAVPEDQKVCFRVGVNLGEVIQDRGAIYGDGVNVAARLESLAEPGGICVSESVRAAAGNRLDLEFEFMGEREVKNIAEPVRAYRVIEPDRPPPLVSKLYETGFRLGDCLVQPAKSRIINSRGEERVEPRVMEVLVTLTKFAGQTVTRDKLINTVWSTNFVSDEVLSRCISLLRRHLEDDPRNPRYIETIPKKGYRLVTAILEPAEGHDTTGLSGSQQKTYGSIAVLPFANLSNDLSYEYFSDGIAEELMSLLAKVRSLKVAARTSAFSFKNKNVDVRVVGKQLDVDAALLGSVRHSNKQLRLSVQLLDTGTGYHIWSEIYHRNATDLFALQVELSRSIVQALRSAMALLPDQITSMLERSTPSTNLDAYHFYLQGKFHWHRRGEAPLRESIALCQNACELDPAFAYAHLTLAKAYSVLPFYSHESRDTAFNKAQASARRALELDTSLGEAHAVLGFTHMHMWNWASAEQEFQSAIRLNPSDATAHQWYGQFLAMVGSMDRAYQHVLIARDLDPISSAIFGRLAMIHLHQGENDLAAENFRIADALGEARRTLVEAYIFLLWRFERFSEMELLFSELQRYLGLGGKWAELLLEAIARPDRRDSNLQALDTPEFAPGLATVFGVAVLLGKVDFAMKTIDRLIKDKTLLVEFLLTPEAQILYSDSRFWKMIKMIGLYDYWKTAGWPARLSEYQDQLPPEK